MGKAINQLSSVLLKFDSKLNTLQKESYIEHFPY